MNNLLVDLFKYRSRDIREAMEDWLTECLAAILRSLARGALADWLQDLTGTGCDGVRDPDSTIDIATQVSIERGEGGRQRPDMIISINGQPWLLFENKVAHHVDHSTTDEGAIVSQMDRYAEWLTTSPFDAEGLSRGLVFVTHHTPVPPDFLAPQPTSRAYARLGRYVSTWGRLARMLERATCGLDEAAHARVLTLAYMTFLEEHGMAEEYPTSRDIALLGLQLGATDRLAKLVNDMFYRIQGIGNWNGNAVWAHADVELGRFNAVRWVHLPKGWPEGAYVNTGLWFPDSPDQQYRFVMDEELADRRLPAVSSAPKVFLQLAHEDDDMFPVKGRPGEDWLRPVTDFFVMRDHDSFYGDPAARAIGVMRWLDERVAELARFVTA